MTSPGLWLWVSLLQGSVPIYVSKTRSSNLFIEPMRWCTWDDGANCDYLLRILFLEYNESLCFLIHLVLQSILRSVQCRDGLLKSSNFIFVPGVLLTQLHCRTKKKVSGKRSSGSETKHTKHKQHQLSTFIHLFYPPVFQSAHERHAAHSSSQRAGVGYQTVTAPSAPAAVCRQAGRNQILFHPETV